MLRTIFLILLSLFAGSSKAGDLACFYALDADLTALRAAGNAIRTSKSIAGQQVTTIQIEGRKVHAVKMGSGCMQTAIAAAAVLARIPCDLAVSVGPTGRLSGELAVGEWVRVGEVVAYQKGSETPAGYVASPNALQRLDVGLGVGAPKVLREGKSIRLASGEIFIASESFRAQLRTATGAQCVDMNLAGLAMACAEARVPLVAWKIVSDSADDAAAVEFQNFVKAYDGEGGRCLAEFIRGLPVDAADPKSHANLKSLLESAE